MARPLRLQVADGVYHVVARGNAGQKIFRDDEDGQAFLSLLSRACRELDWTCWAYCLMGNHYHLLLHTAHPNLSAGMRGLNSGFARRSHDRHQTRGHLFQGRFFSSLIQRDAHVLAVARYIAMNPVQAGLCDSPEDWAWSSHGDTCAGARSSVCDPRPLLELLGTDPGTACEAYRRFVTDGPTDYPADDVGRFGAPGFADELLPHDAPPAAIPRRYLREARRPLHEILDADQEIRRIAEAHAVHGYSLSELARFLGRHRTTIARHLRLAEQG